MRACIADASCAIVYGCFAKVPAGDDSPPVVVCARHKTVAISSAIEDLEANAAAALAQLLSTRDAAIAVGHTAEDLDSVFESRATEVRHAVTTKRIALETEAVTADAALELAVTAVADLEVRALQARFEAAPCPRGILAGRQSAGRPRGRRSCARASC